MNAAPAADNAPDPRLIAEPGVSARVAGIAEPVTFKAYGKIGSGTGTTAQNKPGDAATAQKGTP